jgi:hypothetical protein
VTEALRANRVWGVVIAHAGALGVAVSLRCLCQAAAVRLPVSGVAVSVRSARVVSEVLCRHRRAEPGAGGVAAHRG